jgi:DNA-binding LacI/PurR family transcriptional regulator
MTSATTTQAVSPRVRDAAGKLHRHIRTGGLRPGDRYISAEEASQLLGESVMTAQRAMAHLAAGNILERRPRAGTFIGPEADVRSATSCIQFFLPEQCIYERTMRETYWELIEGMRGVLPNLSAQFNFMPDQDVAFAQQLIEHTSAATLAGAVLVLPSRAIRAYFNQSGVPTIVHGGVEPDLVNLCWLSIDQARVGRLLATWLLERGHRKLVTIMRDVWSIGEHQLHDGVGEAITEAGLAANALLVRSAPVEHAAIEGLVHQLLADPTDCPTGFICRTELQAQNVKQVVDAMGLGDRIDITLCNPPDRLREPVFTCVTPDCDMVEQGKMMGEMFKMMANAVAPESRGRTIDVKLNPVEP